MSPAKSITIIGGGLAGLTLGIALRQRGVPTTIWEAGQYPRHRVCGEFISGTGSAVLERLGLLARFEQAGAFHARTALFICGANRSPVRELAVPALCLSRHEMDRLLADEFQKLGGELRTNQRWAADENAAGRVIATGRRLRAASKNPLWFGVKAHLPNTHSMKLEADLEMHISCDGYVGFNRINGGEVNVCGLLQARDSAQRPGSKLDWLRGQPGSSLWRKLEKAEFDPNSFCAVAGLQLRPQRAAQRGECCIGDALTLTPPVTGNGMSMAFESAELAIEPLEAYSRGQSSWIEAKSRIALHCDAAFQRRLAWAQWLQRMMLSPALQGRLGGILLRSGWLWQVMFARTR